MAYGIKYKLCMLAYKALNFEGPEYITEKLKLHKPTRPMRVGRDILTILTERLPKSTISSVMTDEWNRLPLELRRSSQTEQFKKLLKTHYLKNVFDSSRY